MNLFVKNTITGLFILACLAATASARCPHKCHLLAKRLLKDEQLITGGKFGLAKCTRKCRNLNGKKRYYLDLTEKECKSLCRTARRNASDPKKTKTYCNRKLCGPKKPRIDSQCQQDSDCSKKNVGNCCGYFPKCVNKDFEPNLEALKKWCQDTGTVSVCGWADFDTCQCQEGVCEEVPKPQFICTDDVHECPDGTFVSRSGPNCEFAPCPSTTWKTSCPREKPENGSPCAGKYGYAIGQKCNYNYVDLGCEEGVEECRPTEFYTCSENGWSLALPRPFCPNGDYASEWYKPCDPCPEKPPENGSACANDYNIGQTCDYNFRNISCKEGEENCQPTEHHTCDASGWLVALPTFWCEGDNYPDNFLASCEPPFYCTADAYECPDGKFVGRSGPNCEFDCTPCTEEAETCKNGRTAVRLAPFCKIDCGCDKKAHMCPDGRVVGREGLDCEFNCTPCTEDAYKCPDGRVIVREGPKCEFDCGFCTEELKTCKDGSTVGRVPPLCDFAKCPLDEEK